MPEQLSEGYPRPPIIEAVVELRFRESLSSEAVESVSKRLAKRYPHEQPFRMVSLNYDVAQDTAAVHPQSAGFRRTDLDSTTICVIVGSHLTTSVLAPYPGWDVFYELVNQNYDIFRQTVGVVPLARIGVRYINRIDIPLPGHGEPAISVSDFLRCYPEFPEGFSPVTGFTLQGSAALADQYTGTINQAVVEPALIGHTSILLDIDIGHEGQIPFRIDDILQIIQSMRIRKNELFEACLTDKARRLFCS